MTSRSILIREADNKRFHVKALSHWSEIVSDDGETDVVKWYGGGGSCQLYVSASKGYSYKVDEEGAAGG